MVLVDTSVWIEHLRKGSPALRDLLAEGRVLTHPFVIGELACGHLRNRDEILELVQALPQSKEAEDSEVLLFLEHHELHGSGLGWVDIHLLASALVTRCGLLTLDRRLKGIARELSIPAA
jgi:predicted nucleic acid-binding protein